MPQVIIYAALSSPDDNSSIESQIAECRQYAVAQGWEVIAVESDENKSGFRGSRGTGLVRAKERAAAAPEGTILLATVSDRFARGDVVEATHLIEHVIDGLKGGYRVECVHENIGGQMSLVMAALYGERANADSKAKSAHVKRGKAAAAAAGRVNGGPRRYGFSQVDGTLVPRPDEVAVVQSMFEMARAGKSQTAIARELNEAGHRTAQGNPWSQPKVRYVLIDPIWIGQLRNMAGTFQIIEPVIDPELWHAVQRGFGKAGERRGRPSEKFLLVGGLLRCGCCGSSMRTRNEHYADASRKSYEHYSCSGRRSGATACQQPAVRREVVDSAVLAYFETVALDVEATVKQLAGERNRRLAEIDARLTQARSVQAEAEHQLERLDGLLRDEGMTLDEWRRVAAVPASEAEAAAGAIADLTAERAQVEAVEDVMDATSEFMQRLTALRSTVAGEITQAETVAAARTALRRVFDGFVLHRADAPEAPRRINAELMVDVAYVLEPLVAEDARLGTMAAGTPVLARTPLELERSGANSTSGQSRAITTALLFAPIRVAVT